MTIPEIIKELEPYTGRFPMQAMRAAVEQREAITPELLRLLQSVADNPAEWAKHSDYMLHVFALYLLAEFREKRAYPLAIKIFSAPGETPFDLFGDTVTEGLKRILGSIYDGDPTQLKNLVENENANEYVRNAALFSFVVLEHSGQMPRAEVVGYFHSLFHCKFERTFSYVWKGLVRAVRDLPALELLEEVRQTFQEDLVEGGLSDLKRIEHKLINQEPQDREQYSIISDAIAEMEWWSAFHPKDTHSKQLPKVIIPTLAPTDTRPDSYVAPKPFIRKSKVGRNDLCPCGSGKKYKKCHLALDQQPK